MSGKRVLIGCESSGTVREAFRARGFDAWSCDLLPADDGSEHHLKAPIEHMMLVCNWDLIILHPPCTCLALSGNRWYGVGKEKHHLRVEAAEWTRSLWERAKSVCPRVALENPAGVLPKMADMHPAQFVHPWMFGEEASKKTGLWLHNLPQLQPTNVVGKGEFHVTKSGRKLPKWYNLPPSENRWKIRSKTFQGLADAMAEQWGGVLWSGERHSEKG
jgi:hypothetical protein